jgi:hypothetical protein
MYTLEKLDGMIQHYKELATRDFKEQDESGKEYFNSRNAREADRLQALKELLLAGATVTHVENGYADILAGNKTYRYALLTGKWCTRGKSKYYRSKNPADFVKRYVKKEQQDD